MIHLFPAFGEVFSAIGVREPQPNASEAFTLFGEAHRRIEGFAIKMLKTVKPVSAIYCIMAISNQILCKLKVSFMICVM